jgi:hypothetical protein
VPAGDAFITFASKEGNIHTPLFIAPDTDGTLDLRPDITVSDVTDSKILETLTSPEKERSLLPDLIFSNLLEGLYLVNREGETHVYDRATKQILSLPSTFPIERIGRSEKEGSYLVYSSQSGMVLYDRYGHQALTNLGNLTHTTWALSWSGDTTTITNKEGTKNILGIWWPLGDYITDGQRVMEIE